MRRERDEVPVLRLQVLHGIQDDVVRFSVPLHVVHLVSISRRASPVRLVLLFDPLVQVDVPQLEPDSC